MEAIIFIGVPGSGKSTFYRERFFNTHLRLSLDMLRTRERQTAILRACLTVGQRFVIDNTNVLIAERAPYITLAKEARFRVAAYYFRSELRAAIARNNKRPAKEVVPVPGLIAKWKRLQPPTFAEGFDEMFLVQLRPDNQFVVEPWTGPAEPAGLPATS